MYMNEIFAFLGTIGTQELLIILVIVLLLFGAKKLPELARGLGKSMQEFKKATREVEDNFKEAMNDDPKEGAQNSSAQQQAKKTEEEKK